MRYAILVQRTLETVCASDLVSTKKRKRKSGKVSLLVDTCSANSKRPCILPVPKAVRKRLIKLYIFLIESPIKIIFELIMYTVTRNLTVEERLKRWDA